jgi:hypothetical protein
VIGTKASLTARRPEYRLFDRTFAVSFIGESSLPSCGLVKHEEATNEAS